MNEEEWDRIVERTESKPEDRQAQAMTDLLDIVKECNAIATALIALASAKKPTLH